MTKGRLGDFLIQLGLTDDENKLKLMQYQRTMNDAQLSQWVVKQGIMSEAQLTPLLAKFYGMEYITLNDFNPDPQTVAMLPKNAAKKFNIVPVKHDDKSLTIGADSPVNLKSRDSLRQLTGKKIQAVLMASADIQSAIAQAYQETEKDASSNQDASVADLSQGNYDTVKLVDQILVKALKSGCSDIHIEPEPESLRVRFRVDGVLKTAELLPASLISPLVSRIKVMSGLNIAERRAPQDGGLQFEFQENENSKPISARVSTMPSYYGEKVVLRIQSFHERLHKLDHLGFEQDHLKELKRILSYPHGIFLTTGPSGSGKTTTLYAALNFLDANTLNVLTVEDPIERHIKGIIQTQIDQKYSFQSALRAILRQDPDVIMVGEIRDGETARLALQAALTGHLVLSTLHTNDATSAVTRLIDMGCEAFLVNATVHGVLAQRLVRMICTACRQKYEPTADELKALGIDTDKPEVFHKGTGCSKCNQTGYMGRIPLYELLVVDTGFKKMVASKTDPEYLREYMIQSKMRTLREDGVIKIKKGLTSTAEVIKATVEW